MLHRLLSDELSSLTNLKKRTGAIDCVEIRPKIGRRSAGEAKESAGMQSDLGMLKTDGNSSERERIARLFWFALIIFRLDFQRSFAGVERLG